MQKDIADDLMERKWKEMNLGIDQWKHKYLFPFGQIQPKESSVSTFSTHDSSVYKSQLSQLQRGNSPAKLEPSVNFCKQEDSIFLSDKNLELSMMSGQEHLTS